MHSLTNASIRVVNCERVNGGNHVELAKNLSPSLPSIGIFLMRAGLSTTVAVPAILQSLLKENANLIIESVSQGKSTHPTHKPIALARHLASLLLPPPTYAPRRLLVPFAGSGSEMIGALLAGWEEIVGIEKESEYVGLARARLAWWANLLRWGHTDIDVMLRQWSGDEESDDGEESGGEQIPLF